MRRIVAFFIITVWAGVAGVLPARADVQVRRSGTENPAIEVFRSTIYGALAGLAVGGAIAILEDGGDDAEIVRNGIAIGTLAGLGLGVYWVATRPQPNALLNVGQEGTRLALALPEWSPDGTVRMRLLNVGF